MFLLTFSLILNRAHLVSDVLSPFPTAIKINQDANIYVTEVCFGQTVHFELQEGRQAYLLCIEGDALISGAHGQESLTRHDAAEVFGPNTFAVTAQGANQSPAHLLLVEMAYSGVGRTDL